MVFLNDNPLSLQVKQPNNFNITLHTGMILNNEPLTTVYIVKKIAAELNTLPKYLLFEKEYIITDVNADININVKNMLDIIIQNSQFDPEITSIYNMYKDYFQSPLDIIQPWVAYSVFIKNKNTGNIQDTMLANVAIQSVENLENLENLNINVDNFIADKEDYIQSLKRSILLNRDYVINKEKVLEEFNDIEGVTHTNFELNSINFFVKIDLIDRVTGESMNDMSLMDIFNNFVLTEIVPFVNVNDYYKIHKDFKPPIEWSITSQDVISIWLNPRKDKVQDLKSFINVLMSKNDREIVINLDYNYSSSILSESEIISLVDSTLPSIELRKIEELQDSLSGIYYYPNRSLNKYIMADLVMNDRVFSTFLSINESEKATKKKPSIYMYFKDPYISSEDILTVIITEKIMLKGDYSMKNKNLEIFPYNKPYLRVKINNANSDTMVDNFMDIFSKLLELYNDKYTTLISVYRTYIPNFGKKILFKDIEEETLRLKDIAPDVFIGNYSTKCGNKPTIINKEDAESMPDDEWLLFPPDGENQHYYACNTEKFKYPGLMINKLDNKHIYPYLPCCYAKPGKNTKIYRQYYLGEEADVPIKVQQQIINTNKLALSTGFAFLPINIRTMFELIDTNNIYYRKGMARSPSSFLECVIEALNNKTGFLDLPNDHPTGILTDKERIERTLMHRKELSELETFSITRQENYDMNTRDIRKDLENINVYMDPRKYIRLLELHYNCNIFIFSKENDISGEMILPRFKEIYYTYKSSEKRTILIYEHSGSISDGLTYPQCELIIKWGSEGTDYFLRKNNPIISELNKIFNQLKFSYNIDKKIPDIILPSTDIFTGQYIDTYGKTRLLYIENKYIITLSPIPPLNIKEVNMILDDKWSRNEAIQLNEIFKGNIISQIVNDDILQGLKCTLGNISIIIPIEDSELLFESIPREKCIIDYVYNYSYNFYKIYNKNKSLANYLTQYFLYMFSSYMYENDIRNVENKDIVTFIRKYVTIDPNFVYGKIYRKFTDNDQPKIVLTSKELLKRLVYVLRLELRKNYNEIITYKDKQYITIYYNNISDFDIYLTQVIVKGEDAIEKWIKEKTYNNILHDDIDINTENPYYIKNLNIGKHVFLAQNTDTLNSAIYKGITWLNDHYNPQNIPEQLDYSSVMIIVYLYNSRNNIQKRVLNRGEKGIVRILAYKMDSIVKYTTLMKLKNKNN